MFIKMNKNIILLINENLLKLRFLYRTRCHSIDNNIDFRQKKLENSRKKNLLEKEKIPKFRAFYLKIKHVIY